MPLPSVEPNPPDLRESRLVVPLDAQDASYFAASDRIERRCFNDFGIIVHDMFLWRFCQSFHLTVLRGQKVQDTGLENQVVPG